MGLDVASRYLRALSCFWQAAKTEHYLKGKATTSEREALRYASQSINVIVAA